MPPPTHGEMRLTLREKEARFLFELVVPELVGSANMSVWVKRFKAMVATSIVVCFILTARLHQNWIWEVAFCKEDPMAGRRVSKTYSSKVLSFGIYSNQKWPQKLSFLQSIKTCSPIHFPIKTGYIYDSFNFLTHYMSSPSRNFSSPLSTCNFGKWVTKRPTITL